MRYAKLDGYDYTLFFSPEGRLNQIDIFVDANNAVEIADISTDINRCDNMIFVDGHYAEKIVSKVQDRVFTIFVQEKINERQ